MIIGICGKSGSGKSTLANQIVELTNNKSIHLDIDKVGHEVLLLPNVKEEIVSSFGPSIIQEGIVDRKNLGEMVFNSRHKMKKISDITWEYMQIEIDKFINYNSDKIIILDWLLLTYFWPEEDKELYLEEATQNFHNTEVAIEGKKLILRR